MPAFRRYVRSNNPDAVLPIAYEMNLVAGLALIGVRPRPKLFMTVHNPLRRYAEASAPYRFLAMGLSRLLYQTADRVITVSSGVADELLARKWTSPARISTIYNPIVSPGFASLADAALPATLRHDPSVPAIVNVGRLVPQKNHALLLDAFKLVTEQRPSQLWIVGEGRLRGELERRIDRLGLRESVQLLGHISNPLPVVRAADLFVLSSNSRRVRQRDRRSHGRWHARRGDGVPVRTSRDPGGRKMGCPCPAWRRASARGCDARWSV